MTTQNTKKPPNLWTAQRIKKYLSEGVSVNACDEDGWTALGRALVDTPELVPYLVEQGADVTNKPASDSGYTPIQLAAKHATGCCSLLLSKGASFETPLHHACFSGTLEQVKEHFIKIKDTPKAGELMRCVLYAASGNSVDVIEWLCTQGPEGGNVSPNQADNFGDTPLIYAASTNRLDIVQWLVTHGAVVDQRNNSGFTAMWYALQHSYTEVAKCLHKHGSSVQNSTTRGFPALLHASRWGLYAAVEWLLEIGIPVSEKSQDGYTAFLLAAFGGHVNIMKLLLKHGSLIHEASPQGFTALMLAAEGGHLHAVEFLLEKGGSVTQATEKGYTAVFLAAREGHLEILKYLHQQGASVRALQHNGYTPLLLAAYNGHIEIIHWLMTATSCNVLNDMLPDGYTPLLLAAYNGHVEVMKFLIKNGAQFTEATDNGYTALLLASYNGRTEVIKWLHENDPNINLNQTTPNANFTPFLLACQQGHLDTAQYLVANGATTQFEGHSALLMAATDGHMEVVKWLLESGISNLSEIGNSGETVWAVAAVNGFVSLVKYLVVSGKISVDITEPSKSDNMLMIAARGGHVELVQWLCEYNNSAMKLIVKRNKDNENAAVIAFHKENLLKQELELQEREAKNLEKKKARNEDRKSRDEKIKEIANVHRVQLCILFHKNWKRQRLLILAAKDRNSSLSLFPREIIFLFCEQFKKICISRFRAKIEFGFFKPITIQNVKQEYMEDDAWELQERDITEDEPDEQDEEYTELSSEEDF